MALGRERGDALERGRRQPAEQRAALEHHSSGECRHAGFPQLRRMAPGA
jgi:hypothetical protein